MQLLRRTPILVEVIALIGAIALAWWLGTHATNAWLASSEVMGGVLPAAKLSMLKSGGGAGPGGVVAPRWRGC